MAPGPCDSGKVKTARFSNVVAKAGRPEAHVSWVKPETDSVLQSAQKQHRVLSVHQQLRGAKKDYGVVGVEEASDRQHGVQYLIFPKSIRAFEGQHVVGIQYDDLAPGRSVAKNPPPVKRPKLKLLPQPKPENPPPKPKPISTAPKPKAEITTTRPAEKPTEPAPAPVRDEDPTRAQIR